MDNYWTVKADRDRWRRMAFIMAVIAAAAVARLVAVCLWGGR